MNNTDFFLSFINNNNDSNVIFVTKGINPEVLGGEIPVLNTLLSNKLAYFMSICQKETKIITFEEFIVLEQFIKTQFKKIYVLTDNKYINLYPTFLKLTDKEKEDLLEHFNYENPLNFKNNEQNTDKTTNDELTKIYSNYIKTDYGYACCFNYVDNNLEDLENIQTIYPPISLNKIKVINEIISDEYVQYNICNELDYFKLLLNLKNNNLKYALIFKSADYYNSTINRKLQELEKDFGNRIVIYQKNENYYYSYNRCSKDIYDLMEQYWGYKTFKDLEFYNIEKVENHEKELITISQETIVYNIVEQIKLCSHNQNFHDVFVTAPTGGGKSLLFQLPAIYYANKENLLTIVISPLIGLMNDQVDNLRKHGYSGVATINSDMPQVIKDEVLEGIKENKYNILYLSPESLLSHSDISQIIGNRQVGLLVVDEAHIVTTWGKQFRPDYWFLGDYVQRLRKTQLTNLNSSFIIATFTATSVYEGIEDMYNETLNSLHMIDPITYLGKIKRDNISIEVSNTEAKNKTEYEADKFEDLKDIIIQSIVNEEKTLIYFPTVSLIYRFNEYCISNSMDEYISIYNGQLSAYDKKGNFKDFANGSKLIMLATKAFGMGIDIPDIKKVVHFAPTGNVCDYMQEIGRAGRNPNIQAHAIYKHMKNDFKHINKLYGLSSIRKYQLISIMKKILELYSISRKEANNEENRKYKANSMLIDTRCFEYIFESSYSDEEVINKVKTAMLLIQKDYERHGFSPFHLRPIPMFKYGYFSMPEESVSKLNKLYKNCIELKNKYNNVYRLDLQKMWEMSSKSKMSFPKYKFLFYTKNKDLQITNELSWETAIQVSITKTNSNKTSLECLNALKQVTRESIKNNRFLDTNEIRKIIKESLKINTYQSECITDIFISTLNNYNRKFSKHANGDIFKIRSTSDNIQSYKFSASISIFFKWLQNWIKQIENFSDKYENYIADKQYEKNCDQVTVVLGLLEAFGLLNFKVMGGSSSQIYLYMNETKNMQNACNKPERYNNQLLNIIGERHKQSVKMMSFLFQNNFTSEQIWEHLENYFLGILPPNLN